MWSAHADVVFEPCDAYIQKSLLDLLCSICNVYHLDKYSFWHWVAVALAKLFSRELFQGVTCLVEKDFSIVPVPKLHQIDG